MSDEQPKKNFNENRVGRVKLGKALSSGKEYLYMDFDRDISFKKGDRLFLNDIQAGIEKQVADGKLSRNEADARLAKISFLIYDVNLPAAKS